MQTDRLPRLYAAHRNIYERQSKFIQCIRIEHGHTQRNTQRRQCFEVWALQVSWRKSFCWMTNVKKSWRPRSPTTDAPTERWPPRHGVTLGLHNKTDACEVLRSTMKTCVLRYLREQMLVTQILGLGIKSFNCPANCDFFLSHSVFDFVTGWIPLHLSTSERGL